MGSRAPLYALFALLFLAAAALSVSIGSVGIGPAGVFEGLAYPDSLPGRIIWFVRFPRTLAALLAGAALAVSGAVIQETLANPLAGPGVIGVNAGAGFFMSLCYMFFPFSFMRPAAAFLGGLFTVLLVCLIADRTGASRMAVVLSGVAMSSLMTAGINAVSTLKPDVLADVHAFQLGGLAGSTLERLFPAAWLILAVVAALLFMAGELDVLALGAETASSLGLDVRKYRFVFLALAAALTGSAVSFAGLVGFVGLIAPHIIRIFIGSGHSRSLLALSALGGGAFLALCDALARWLFSPFELPVGILTAALGAPFFLWLLARRGKVNT